MSPIRTRWLALVALAATACHTDRPGPSAAEPQATAAVPVLPAAESPGPEPAVMAMPILPAGGGGAAPAGDAAPAAGSRAERMEALKSDYERAMDAYYELFRKAETDEERMRIAKTSQPPDPAPFHARARALVDEDPADETGFDALCWSIANQDDPEQLGRDIALLGRHHSGNARMVDALTMLQYSRSAAGTALLEEVGRESPHREVRGRALMAQATALANDLTLSAGLAEMGDSEERRGFVHYAGQAELDRLLALERAPVERRIVGIYETVLRDYADVPAPRAGVIGDQAKAALYEMEHLVVGKVAPDIAGEDIQGVAFKLSDYRGKVVLLDFWGHW